jgi:hypothetical protein
VGGAAGWEQAMAELAAAPRGPVLCFPQSLYDELAYRTGQPVLFGGHGFGFRRLEPVYPRLCLPVAELRRRYGLRYVLAREDAVNERFLADLASAPAREFGAFRVWTFEPHEEPGTGPAKRASVRGRAP